MGRHRRRGRRRPSGGGRRMRSSRGASRSRAARRTRPSRSRRAPRSPDPRRTRTRARLSCGIAWEETVRNAFVRTEPSRRAEDVETFGRRGKISEPSDNTQQARRSKRARPPRASAETPDARFEATFAVRGKIVSSSRVRTCGENGDAPSARAFPRTPLSARPRIRLATEQRQHLRGAGRRRHGDRARTPDQRFPRRVRCESERRVTGDEASRHRFAPSNDPRARASRLTSVRRLRLCARTGNFWYYYSVRENRTIRNK